MIRRWFVLTLLGLSMLTAGGCGPLGVDDSGSTYAPIAVPQSRKMPALVTIGVIYSSVGQGSDWYRPANGAVIAEYRLKLGLTKVAVTAIDDHGDATQASAAVNQLIADGASGIVIASEGAHLNDALGIASSAQIPVILPYDAPKTLPPGVWTTAPTQADLADSLTRAFHRLKATSPLLIEADGEHIPMTKSRARVAYTGSNAEDIKAEVTSLAARGQIDSIVISGSARSQAVLAGLIQAVPHYRSPILLMPHALSPVFATDLLRAYHGTLNASLAALGISTGQIAALSQTQAGEQAAAFYNGVTMAATAPKSSTAAVLALDGQPLSAADLMSADTASHDAVVALVDAIHAANSVVPREVLRTLRSLSLELDDGLAGPGLSFKTPHALHASSVVLMNATPENPHLVRLGNSPQSEGPVPLFWFATPGQ